MLSPVLVGLILRWKCPDAQCISNTTRVCLKALEKHFFLLVVTLAWHTRPHKIRSQTHELTCEACHVHNRKSLGANVGIFLGMDLWSISPLYITLRFDTCMEHFNICGMHF